MRKWVTAGLVGLALIGTKAVADDSAVLRSDNGSGSTVLGGLPTGVLLFFTALTVGMVAWASHDNGGSPASP